MRPTLLTILKRKRFGENERAGGEKDQEIDSDCIPVPNIGMLQEAAHSSVCLHIDLAVFFPPSKVKGWLNVYICKEVGAARIWLFIKEKWLTDSQSIVLCLLALKSWIVCCCDPYWFGTVSDLLSWGSWMARDQSCNNLFTIKKNKLLL